ncbi:mannose-1-phosphate guanylyltransferase/mannose-6-phosphate isomerase [Defluviimonas sp. CAU 1641]|uniref:mannose-1-phosphate guanylyltransferase n=3 Tax=Albidovulum TaxID=205889 RepID=A0ABT3IXI2_9RHOB|nr:mannose-1-phosphate guanylyltransferase/mannose-6-phosphate isomerase [Defluviimonas salinarum]
MRTSGSRHRRRCGAMMDGGFEGFAARRETIIPVVLCGGTGTRLWPVSRAGMAKQLLAMQDGETLLQITLRRVMGPGFAAPVVVGSAPQRFTLRDQVEAIVPGARIVVEPERRDTLAAVLLAAAIIARDDPDAVVAVVPSDHLIRDGDAFRSAVAMAAARVGEAGVAVIGIVPDAPSTAYGYVRPGHASGAGCFSVAKFVEKPEEPLARRLIAEGCLWNAGIFCFRAGWLVAAMETVDPQAVAAVGRAVGGLRREHGFLVPGSDFADIRAISFDHGFMECTRDAHVVPAGFRWSDLGDWNAVWAAAEKDGDGNAIRGAGLAIDARGNMIHSEGRLVCALGVEGLAIVETPDAVMVAPRERAQDVKALVGALTERRRPEATEHARTHRPWGWFQTTDLGERFRVKRIVVKPGAMLSLQRHRYRAEHWVVVRGTAEVTLEGKVFILRENESTYVAIGAVHRLANPAEGPLELIEVQTGDYLGEDDIERMEDAFGRV